MNILFHINYKTTFGEDLILNVIDKIEHGVKTVSKYRMNTLNGEQWTYSLEQKTVVAPFEYFYSVQRGESVERCEWGLAHKLETNCSTGSLINVYDHWIDIPANAYLYSSAMAQCVSGYHEEQLPQTAYTATLRLKVRAPQLRRTDRLALCGDQEVLGRWNPSKAVAMYEHNYNEWVCDIDATKLAGQSFCFKFIINRSRNADVPMWEKGDNRVITLPQLHEGETVVYELDEASFDIYNIRCAGTQIPVFSLRSKSSFGVGDFGDLKKFIDWMVETRQRVLQLLPVNDTHLTNTWVDSYPYSCNSVFALHPQYVDISALPPLKDKKAVARFEALRLELNALLQEDYEQVNKVKGQYFKLIFEQERHHLSENKGYKRFFEENKYWLAPYAQYRLLQQQFGTTDFTQWTGHTRFNEADRHDLEDAHTKLYHEVELYYYEQYVLSSQLDEVHDYARLKGVIIKGDIPIGVNRQGCDAWFEPRYFNMNGQAGAPPDAFATDGQNWGFPTYNWDEMLADGCVWWIRRLTHMARYFDAYRIDHVLGFFRIWEIPVDAVSGLLGQFAPSLGMTREEIQAYGFPFDEDRYTRPFITDWIIDRVFHERAGEVKEKYLEQEGNGMWRMRPEYDTQRKVEAAFAGETRSEELNLRDGLYALIGDVLFLRDHRDPNKFHPRICVQYAFVYESLYDCDKNIFNRLYNDYFYRRNNQFWYREAMKKLPLLVDATRMLVCAEDLGMVPDCVAWVMNELHILTLEMQSMPKDPHVRFGHLSRNPYLSVCTISSHDTPTLRQWWDEDWPRTQEYYNSMLYREGAAPHPLPGWLARDIVSRHLTCPSMLCILTLQDWLSIDENLRLPDENAERINVPAEVPHYWRWRMHINIEDLMANNNFTENIKQLVLQSGRM